MSNRRRWIKCIDPSLSSYSVAIEGQPNQFCIKFAPCGVVSFHPDDVKNHYCAFCHEFIVRRTDVRVPVATASWWSRLVAVLQGRT